MHWTYPALPFPALALPPTMARPPPDGLRLALQVLLLHLYRPLLLQHLRRHVGHRHHDGLGAGGHLRGEGGVLDPEPSSLDQNPHP